VRVRVPLPAPLVRSAPAWTSPAGGLAERRNPRTVRARL